jgi:1-acyl-sn-glycerol-3-phosphate acyltransferase
MSSADLSTLIGTSNPPGSRAGAPSGPSYRKAATAARGEALPGRIWEACKHFNYRVGQLLGRIIFFQTMNAEVVRPEAAERAGAYVLAPTHLSHLEPFCLGILVRRKVDWMARLEFFRRKWAAALLYAVDSFPVNRFGVPVSAVRTAIARARKGRVVGVFPEGGVAVGAQSVCRGGPMKKGAFLVAHRAGVPVLPCVVLGTYRLNEVRPWLPFRRAYIWVIYGRPIEPKPHPDGPKAARAQMAAEWQAQVIELYHELRGLYGIPETDVP